MGKLHFLEILPVAIYLLVLFVLGFRKKDAAGDQTDFILGGRQLTLPAFVATWHSSMYTLGPIM